jgi:hypothetical protein
MNANGNHGYEIGSASAFSGLLELMNDSTKLQKYYLTVKWEWLPMAVATAAGYKKVTALWMDVSGACGVGDVPARSGTYSYSHKWTSSLSGPIVETVAHMHDGGVDTNITINGKSICVSKQA